MSDHRPTKAEIEALRADADWALEMEFIKQTAAEIRKDLATFDATWSHEKSRFAEIMRGKSLEYRQLLRELVRERLDERFPPDESGPKR